MKRQEILILNNTLGSVHSKDLTTEESLSFYKFRRELSKHTEEFTKLREEVKKDKKPVEEENGEVDRKKLENWSFNECIDNLLQEDVELKVSKFFSFEKFNKWTSTENIQNYVFDLLVDVIVRFSEEPEQTIDTRKKAK